MISWVTRDHGPQPIRRIGRPDVQAAGDRAPVRIRRGGLTGLERDLVLLFDQHEVTYAEGAATESFLPRGGSVAAVDPAAREVLSSLFPDLRTNPDDFGRPARRCLRAAEARLIGQPLRCAR